MSQIENPIEDTTRSGDLQAATSGETSTPEIILSQFLNSTRNFGNLIRNTGRAALVFATVLTAKEAIYYFTNQPETPVIRTYDELFDDDTTGYILSIDNPKTNPLLNLSSFGRFTQPVYAEEPWSTIVSVNSAAILSEGPQKSLTKVVASWVHPSVTCTSPDQMIMFYVRSGGFQPERTGDNNMVQIGSGTDCSNNTHFIWYENYRNGVGGITTVKSIVIGPGEELRGGYRQEAGGKVTVAVKNENRPWLQPYKIKLINSTLLSQASVGLEHPTIFYNGSYKPAEAPGHSSFTVSEFTINGVVYYNRPSATETVINLNTIDTKTNPWLDEKETNTDYGTGVSNGTTIVRTEVPFTE